MPTCTQHYEKRANETRGIIVDLTDILENGETITAVDASASIPTGITIAAATFNAADLLVDGRIIQESKAITARISAGTAGVDYEIVFNITTSASQDIEVDGISVSVTANKGT